jgi:hypothetical protein
MNKSSARRRRRQREQQQVPRQLLLQSLRYIAALLVAASTFALAGCTWFDPPKEVSAEAETLASQIRALDGVAEVDVDVRSRDMKDHAGDWIFYFRISTTNSKALQSSPSAIEAVTNQATVYGVDVAVELPASIGVAPVVLRDLSATTVRAAGGLRVLPEVTAVTVGGEYGGTTVDMSPDASLAETAAALRSVTGYGADTSLTGYDPLHTITIQWDGAVKDTSHFVEIGATGPSDPVLRALDGLGADSSVDRIYAVEEGSWWYPTHRPTIEISANSVRDVVDRLTTTLDPAAEAGLRPRTAFRVTIAPGAEYDGYVGLPLGSAEPQELPAPPTPPTPPVRPEPVVGELAPTVAAPEWVPSTDPAVLAQLTELTGEVEAFLHNVEAISGVTEEISTNVGPCATAGLQSSVTGYIVLPIYDIADSADAAFAAIVGNWVQSGLNRSDRAMGLDIYSNRSADAVIVDATIRGTTEGIRVSATSVCV